MVEIRHFLFFFHVLMSVKLLLPISPHICSHLFTGSNESCASCTLLQFFFFLCPKFSSSAKPNYLVQVMLELLVFSLKIISAQIENTHKK